MSKIYEPDSQFLEKLEWQLSSEYRRAKHLKSSPGKITIPRRMIAAVCIVGALMTGVTVIRAAEYIKDSWRKKIEIARAETEIKLKMAHVESTREIESRASVQFSNGLIREEEYREIEVAAERAELDLRRAQLNLDEVKVSGEAPRNELYAPLVGRRDFVSERLNIERKEVELDLELLRRRLGRFKQMLDAGLVEADEFDRIQSEVADREAIVIGIQNRLDLRKRFIAGEITAQQVEIQDRITAARRNLHAAQSKVDFINGQLERLKALEIQGLVTPTEVKQMQYVLNAAQAELKLATIEMEVLEKVK